MTEANNTNPDFFRASSATDNSTLIYSTLDYLVIGGEYPGLGYYTDAIADTTKTLTIYALNLVISGKLTLPAAEVQIYCRNLIIPAVDDNSPGAAIDVTAALADGYDSYFTPSGTDGAKGDDIAAALQKGQGGAYGVQSGAKKDSYKFYGTEGITGGSITISCDSITLQGTLELRADGSAGYPGCAGQSSRTKPRGGQGGRGGVGGIGGSIKISAVNPPNNADRISYTAAGGTAGLPGQGGLGTETNGLAAPPQSAGAAGFVWVNWNLQRNALGHLFDEVFLLKVLQKIKLLYLFNSPEDFDASGNSIQTPKEWSTIGSMLTWLSDVLADFPTLTLFGTSSSDGYSDSDMRKRYLNNSTLTLFGNWQSNRTYFGEYPDTVPAESYDSMVTRFNDAFEISKSMETSYFKLASEFTDAEKAQENLDAARQKSESMVDVYRQSCADITKQIKILPEKIETAAVALDQATAEFQNQLKDFKVEIKKKFSWDWDQFWSSIGTLGFAAPMLKEGGAGVVGAGIMATANIGNMVYQGEENVYLNDGTPVRKDYVIDQIVTLKSDVVTNACNDLFTVNADGKVVYKDDKAKMFITELDEFDSELKSLINSFGKDVIDPVLTALEDYEDALKEKNNTKILYNMLLLKYGETYQQWQDAEADYESKEEIVNPVTPYFAGQVATAAKHYQSALETLLETAGNIERKGAYLTLGHKADIDLRSKYGTLWDTGTQPSQVSMDDLKQSITTINANVAKYESSQRSPDAQVPKDDSHYSDFFVHITDADMLKTLKEEGKLKFKIVPGDPDTGAYTPQITAWNADAYYDIRITHALPQITGVATNSGKLRITISHGIRSDIVDASGNLFDFTYEYPRYSSLVQSTTDVSDYGSGAGGKLTDDYLDALGLFGTWTLYVPDETGESDNAGLKLDGVTDIKMYFIGYAHASANT